MSVKQLKYQVKFLASNNCVQLYQHAISEFFKNLEYDKFDKKYDIGDAKTSLNEFNYDELQEITVVITCSGIRNNSDFTNFATYIHKMWCKVAMTNAYLQWLIPENSYISSKKFITIGSLRPIEIAFGTLPAMKDYVQMYHFHHIEKSSSTLSSLLCNFNHLQKEVTIFVSNTHKHSCNLSGEMGYKICFPYDSIIRVIANMDSDLIATEVFLQLEYPPFIYVNIPTKAEMEAKDNPLLHRVTKVKEMEYGAKKFERTFEMGCSCNYTLWHSKHIGKNLVLKLVIEDKFQFRWNLEQLSLRCAKKTEICVTSVKTHNIKKENIVKLRNFPHYIYGKKNGLVETEKFSCDYAWNVVHSRSNVILHQMSLKAIESSSYITKLTQSILSFSKSNISAFVKSLYFIADMIEKGFVFNFMYILKQKFKYFCDFVELNELPKGMIYVRRVLITPSRIIFLQPYEHFDNRIVRKFGVEFMMRSSVQDDNFSKMTYAVQYNTRKEEIMETVVGNILCNGISIGSRKYELLACSTSQLREHGMWLYAKDYNHNTASIIRNWMGDFTSINNVAKYMARMGQCLSSTETGVQILINDDDEIDMPDIKTRNGRYIFSDGIGIISSELAEEVRQFIRQNSSDVCIDEKFQYKPVAFQIRYRGCKGMVVEHPIPGRKLGIRPSMKKFECTTSKYLEIVKTSAPRKLFLNKHLITILEQMGIGKEVFMKLEVDMMLNLLDSLMDEQVAADLLIQNLSPAFPFDTLQKAGLSLTSDPFFRSLLLAYFKSFAEKLKINMRIAIPEEYGRNMLGVLDETKTLDYGHVFVRYSKSLTDPSAGFEVLKGPVLVTKNPSLHPGDVRKLVAIDVPKLHHITDCIVFPAKGRRPHPDEMAGSDLDGDEMVVLWYKPLIFSRKNAKPMDYPVYEEERNTKDIKLDDMMKFFCQYIQNDNIGTFAHAHLVWADMLETGIFSKKCMAIAKRYPYVLDFAKHGTTEYLQKSERPNCYPDFMQKGLRGNTYHSHKALGVLYRTSRVVDACSSKIILKCETSSHDPDLEYPGWELYEHSAEMHRKEYVSKVSEVLDRYCLISEAEAFSGFIELEAYKKWRQEKSNAIKVVKKYLSNIMGHYRNLFLTEVRQEAKENNLNGEKRLQRRYQRASAWYMVVYGKKSSKVLSFPWVISDILSEIKKKRNKNKDLADSMCVFFSEIDCDIKKWCSEKSISSVENCLCSYLLKEITQTWISESGLNVANSDDDAYCTSCYGRIITFYNSKTNMNCCSSWNEGTCTCSDSCSPAKLLIHFLKFFINNEGTSLGNCQRDSCNGFLSKNLQEFTLQTYSYIAITRNISYLGIQGNFNNPIKKSIPLDVSEAFNEEQGDPIKVPVNSILKDLIDRYLDDIAVYLKKASGVQDITLTPDIKSMCLIVNSIGKNWQRWNLQEILLDTNFIQNLKQNLNI